MLNQKLGEILTYLLIRAQRLQYVSMKPGNPLSLIPPSHFPVSLQLASLSYAHHIPFANFATYFTKGGNLQYAINLPV